jgi:hypothetical protein
MFYDLALNLKKEKNIFFLLFSYRSLESVNSLSALSARLLSPEGSWGPHAFAF